MAASDGVWEGLSASEAVTEVCDSLAQGRSANGAAHALCQSAVDVVQATGRHAAPDNTTAALIIFDQVLGE